MYSHANRLRASLLLLVFGSTVPFASAADSVAVVAAEDAVRQAVRQRSGSNKRVVFENPTETLLSLSEVTVTGQGHVQDKSDWNFDEAFDFSIKVKLDGSSTRDLKLTYRDGRRINDQKSWTQVAERSTLRITEPKWYQSFDGNSVRVLGVSSNAVLLEVFDSRNRRVLSEQLDPSLGQFNYTIRSLDEGNYRVVVRSEGRDGQEDEVRFSIANSSHDWGHPQPTLTVTQPSREAVLHSSQVTLGGQTTADTLRVHIWDANDREMLDREVNSRGGYWSVSTDLPDGSYHFRVESGSMRETRRFQVDRSLAKKRDYLNVEEPAEDSLAKGGRLTVAGRSSESQVRVVVLDDQGRSVVSRTVPTRDMYWNTSIPLGSGSYLVEVSSGSSGVVRRRIRVKGGGESPVPSVLRLRVFEPARDGTIFGPAVTISGNSQEDRVSVQLWDDRNNRFMSRDVPCRQGYWSTQTRLAPGTYRVRVESASGWDHEEFTFRVN